MESMSICSMINQGCAGHLSADPVLGRRRQHHLRAPLVAAQRGQRDAQPERRPDAVLEKGQVNEALQTARAQVATPAGRIFTDVLARHSSDSLEYLADLTEEKRFEEVEALKGPLWVLGTVGASAPFIGLFGTVVGIIKAFHNMALMGSGGFSVVAAGISEALIATGLGLGVAIIAVIFFNYFQTRIERIEAALTIASNRVLDAIHLGRQAHGAR